MHPNITILTPKEDEFVQIRQLINGKRDLSTASQKVHFDLGIVMGNHFDWQVAVVNADQGGHPFALKTMEAITELQPDLIILAGTAGGIKDVNIGDILIADAAANYESGKEMDGGLQNRPQIIVNKSIEYLTVAKRIMRAWQKEVEKDPAKPNCFAGQIVSGDKVLADIGSQTFQRIRQIYGEAKGVEMEAFEFAQAAYRENIPYLNIRGISDLIQNKQQSDQLGNRKVASYRTKEFLNQFIQNLPKPIALPLYQAKIKYTHAPLTAIGKRNPDLGVIIIYPKWICFQFKNEEKIIREIKEMVRYKMSGDIAKNWIKLEYLHQETSQTIYITEVSFADIGSLVGGSKALFRELKKFQESAIRLF